MKFMRKRIETGMCWFLVSFKLTSICAFILAVLHCILIESRRPARFARGYCICGCYGIFSFESWSQSRQRGQDDRPERQLDRLCPQRPQPGHPRDPAVGGATRASKHKQANMVAFNGRFALLSQVASSIGRHECR